MKCLRRGAGSSSHGVVIALCFTLLAVAGGALTRGGRPGGQTIAVTGTEYLHYTLSRLSLSVRRRSHKSSHSHSHHTGTNSTKRVKKRVQYTLAPGHAFYTLRDSLCTGANVSMVVSDGEP